MTNSRWIPFWFGVFACGGFMYAWSLVGAKSTTVPVAEEHNVAVLSQLGSDEWRMHSDEEGSFVYRACPDFPNQTVIQVGYIADRAKWKEYGECRSIRDVGLGFWYRVDHDQYRKVN